MVDMCNEAISGSELYAAAAKLVFTTIAELYSYHHCDGGDKYQSNRSLVNRW